MAEAAQIQPAAQAQAAKPSSGIQPSIKNIVATISMGIKLDLQHIAKKCNNTEYQPRRFTAAIMRIKEPKTTALVFSTGRMVVTGAKTEDDCKAAARKYCKQIKRAGYDVSFKEFRIQNMVGVCDVKFQIRLEALQMHHKAFCTYEPEVFPGAIYRMMQPKVVLLIFVSGRVVLTGAKSRQDIIDAFEAIYPSLTEYKKRTAAGAAAAAGGAAAAAAAGAAPGAGGKAAGGGAAAAALAGGAGQVGA